MIVDFVTIFDLEIDAAMKTSLGPKMIVERSVNCPARRCRLTVIQVLREMMSLIAALLILGLIPVHLEDAPSVVTCTVELMVVEVKHLKHVSHVATCSDGSKGDCLVSIQTCFYEFEGRIIYSCQKRTVVFALLVL